MNFFEQELHKIVAPKYPDATYEAGPAMCVSMS